MDLSVSTDAKDPETWKTIIRQNDDNDFFAAARTREFNSLVNKGMLKLVPLSHADGYRFYNARIFDEVKHLGAPTAYAKSRLVVQAFNDKEHGLQTGAPPCNDPRKACCFRCLSVVVCVCVFIA